MLAFGQRAHLMQIILRIVYAALDDLAYETSVEIADLVNRPERALAQHLLGDDGLVRHFPRITCIVW